MTALTRELREAIIDGDYWLRRPEPGADEVLLRCGSRSGERLAHVPGPGKIVARPRVTMANTRMNRQRRQQP